MANVYQVASGEDSPNIVTFNGVIIHNFDSIMTNNLSAIVNEFPQLWKSHEFVNLSQKD